MGILSPLADTTDELFLNLSEGKTGVQAMADWTKYHGLKSLLGAPAKAYDNKIIPRNARRSMSRMSEMAFLATKAALRQADLGDISGERSLICMGSTTGSPPTFEEYFRKFFETNGFSGQLSTSFFKIMNHSVASNVAVGLDFKGPQLAVASACSTSTQAIITGWELISSGLYDLVVAGGADELHVTSAAIFDNVHAASTKYNDRPLDAPRPFDSDRDGLVVGEGAGVVILEAEDCADKRGARKLAYIDGGAYHCDGEHMTQPQAETMMMTMRHALRRARFDASKVQYVNAHGTATLLGDQSEAEATVGVFGPKTPVSSIKGHIGHTLAACGAIEVIATIEMMRHGILIPNRNLTNIDTKLPPMNLLKEVTEASVTTAISNNFAFGGMNASVIFSATKDLLS